MKSRYLLRNKSLVTVFCVSLVVLLSVSSAQAQLTFNLIPASGMSSQAITGFQEAADRWSNVFNDNITINLNIDFATLSGTTLASAGSTKQSYSYSSFTSALGSDVSSANDSQATGALPGGSTFDMLINRTTNSPYGAGSATPYFDTDGDDNNFTIRSTTANAKALGLLSGTASGSDANISFNNTLSWDFDPSDGITSGTYDFVGIAAHEIGHAMGFTSGVSILDNNSPPVNGPFSDHQFVYVSPLDMFRFSAQSIDGAAGTIDWTADTRAKYFSIDQGLTNLGGFSTGKNFGDGRQASHWKDSLGLGIFDPTSGSGELLQITSLDIQAFDVIGYDLVPEPTTVGMMILGSLALLRRRRAR